MCRCMSRTHTYTCVYMFHELNNSIQALFEGLCAAGKAKQAHFEVMLRTSSSWEDRLSILKRCVCTYIVFVCYICVYVSMHADTYICKIWFYVSTRIEYMCLHVYIRMHSHADMCTYTYVSTYKHTHTRWSKETPPPGWFPIYYVRASTTVCKRTPLKEFVPGFPRGFPLHTVLDEGT